MQNVNKVLYTQDQSGVFSTEQKAVARNNIGAQAALTAGPNIDIINDIVSTEKSRVVAGTNVSVDSVLDNTNRVVTYTVSASDTKYSAGNGLNLNGTEFSVDTSVVQPKLTAGDNVQIDQNNVISATDTKYTAGSNVQINSSNVISATDTKYTAGANVSISNTNEISATDTTYTAGTNVQISSGNVISATDTKYTAGTNVQIDSNNVISSTTVFRTWIFRDRTVTITAQDLSNGYVDFLYVLGDDGVVACEHPNIIGMKGYDIEMGNQLNGRTLSFLLVPHGGGTTVLIDSGFQLYTESVVNNYSWKAFKAIGLTMGANVGKYDAVLRVSLDGTEPVGGTIETSGRVAVTLVGLV